MITVKKDALKYKDSDGQMQSVGVLANVGTFGTNWLDYAVTITRLFQGMRLPDDSEIHISFGDNAEIWQQTTTTALISYFFYRATGVKSFKISSGLNVEKGDYTSAFESVNNTNYSTLKTIDISGLVHIKPTSINRFAYYQNVLEEIIGDFDLTLCTSLGNAFNYCYSLKEIRFVENTINLSINFAQSSLLSAESIQSIIDGLATVETAQTLTLHADVKAKLTEAQISQITSKNWTLA